MDEKLEQLCANTIRCLAMDAVQNANSGHPGMPMGMADAAFVLWAQFLKHDPRHPEWADRDRFVLSAGHGSMLLYAMLHLTGYDLPLEQLKRFRQWESMTPGHPEYGAAPGIEATTGPLGQGISMAVGMALAERLLAARFNKPDYELVDHYTYTICSDGDLMEGVAAEAVSLAGHWGLGKLIALYDDNDISLAAPTSATFTEDVTARFEAYGWHVLEIDGHDRAAVAQAIRAAQAETARPTLIRCHTHIGYGSPNKQDTPGVHGAPLGEEELALTKKNLGWEATEPFFVPAEVRDYFAKLQRGWAQREAEWQKMFEGYRAAYPEEAAQWQTAWAGELPAGWQDAVPTFAAGEDMATRNASGEVLNAIAPHLPLLIGGAADLASSTKTYLKGHGDVQRDNFGERNLRFGVREHGMGAILNGMSLHGGLRVYGSTFLVFADYVRPAIRLSALMKQPVTYVFTHDSIFSGEDGPTHQPIEHLAMLRATPNLLVIRPCDANEVAAAWQVALETKDKPTVIVMTRQKVPTLDRAKFAPAEGLRRGAYILADADDPDVILIGTGSEVHICIAARELLAQEGIAARVVSMLCWKLFEEQPEEYKREVFPPAMTKRVAVEAMAPLGWERYVGTEGAIVAIENRFGASAPYKVIAEKFGFTAEDVAARAKMLIHET